MLIVFGFLGAVMALWADSQPGHAYEFTVGIASIVCAALFGLLLAGGRR